MTVSAKSALPPELLEVAREAVAELPFVHDIQQEVAGGEAIWRLRTHDDDVFVLTPTTEDGTRTRSTTHGMVVVGERFTRPVVKDFIQHRINFVDGAGNLQLVLGGRYFAHVEGKRASREVPEMRGPAYQVLLAWLLDPGLLSAPLRTTASVAGVSRTAVRDMRARLMQWGYVVGDRHSRAWTPRGRREARRMWLEGYRSTLRPTLDLGGYRLKGSRAEAANLTHVRRVLLETISQQEAVHAPRCLWSGAEALRHVAGLSSYFVTDPEASEFDDLPVVGLAVDPRVDDVTAVLPLARSEMYNIRVRKLPIAAAAEHDGLTGWPPCVPHPLMVWTELMCDSDPRAHEAAEALREALPAGWL